MGTTFPIPHIPMFHVRFIMLLRKKPNNRCQGELICRQNLLRSRGYLKKQTAAVVCQDYRLMGVAKVWTVHLPLSDCTSCAGKVSMHMSPLFPTWGNLSTKKVWRNMKCDQYAHCSIPLFADMHTGRTALHQSMQADIVKRLCIEGADVNIRDLQSKHEVFCFFVFVLCLC
jgi:hypothetical protein